MDSSTVHYQGFLLRPMALHLPEGYLSLVSVSDENSQDQLLLFKSSVTADGLFDSGITAIDTVLSLAQNLVDDVTTAERCESDDEHNAKPSGKQSKEWSS